MTKIAAAVAFSTGIVLACAALANPMSPPDPNCPTCSFVTGAIDFYGVGLQCTWIMSNKQSFTTNADSPAFQAMSELLHRAFLDRKPVTIEYSNVPNNDNGVDGVTPCAAVLEGTTILGASVLATDQHQ